MLVLLYYITDFVAYSRIEDKLLLLSLRWLRSRDSKRRQINYLEERRREPREVHFSKPSDKHPAFYATLALLSTLPPRVAFSSNDDAPNPAVRPAARAAVTAQRRQMGGSHAPAPEWTGIDKVVRGYFPEDYQRKF